MNLKDWSGVSGWLFVCSTALIMVVPAGFLDEWMKVALVLCLLLCGGFWTGMHTANFYYVRYVAMRDLIAKRFMYTEAEVMNGVMMQDINDNPVLISHDELNLAIAREGVTVLGLDIGAIAAMRYEYMIKGGTMPITSDSIEKVFTDV